MWRGSLDPFCPDSLSPLHAERNDGIMGKTMIHESVDYVAQWLPLNVWEIVHESTPECPDGWNAWHDHDEAEFLAILEGSMIVETARRQYEMTPGSVLALGSCEPHRTYKASHVRYIVLQLNLQAMLDVSPGLYSPILSERPHPLSHHNAIYDNVAVRRESFALIQKILEETSRRQNGFELAVSGCVRLLLMQIVRHGFQESEYLLHRMKDVLDYIERHLAEPLRIRDMLPLVNVSYHHFMKSFKQYVGMSFIDYVHARRIREAEKLLLIEHWNNEIIGRLCGFATPAQFYGVFKRINGCSPREFRKRMAGNAASNATLDKYEWRREAQ